MKELEPSYIMPPGISLDMCAKQLGLPAWQESYRDWRQHVDHVRASFDTYMTKRARWRDVLLAFHTCEDNQIWVNDRGAGFLQTVCIFCEY